VDILPRSRHRNGGDRRVMPRRSLRGRAKKRVQVRIPGNHTVTRYKKDKTKPALCCRCGQPLAGLPRASPTESGKLSPTKRKIERSFGGQLCHNCLRQLIKQTIRTARI
jgi:large subunit ribosomal protein L34e